MFDIPGSLTKKEYLEQLFRVNHAGEYGAKRIYQGQMDALKHDKESIELLQHMAEQEQEHLDYFSNKLHTEQVRPSALMPIWHVAGYALGYATAKISKEAAMACTVAVEEVIDEHYQEQLQELKTEEDCKELTKSINKFREEELEHRDIGINNDAEKAFAYKALTHFIKTGSKLAIFLAKKI